MSSTPPTEATRVHRTLSMYCLRGVSGATFGKVFPLLPRTVIGRRRDCDLVLQEEGVSRQHAVIEVSGTSVTLKDLNAANGTFVNGQRVRSVELTPGDELAFDTVRFRFEESGGAPLAAPAPQPPPKAPPPPVKPRRRYGWLLATVAMLLLAAGAALVLL